MIPSQDCFATHPDLGMTTSAGSYAFLQGQPIQNTPIVEKVPERCLQEPFSTVTDLNGKASRPFGLLILAKAG